MTITIDDNIPMPKGIQTSKRLIDLDEAMGKLEHPGQSFWVAKKRSLVGDWIWNRQSRGDFKGMRFATRTLMQGGVMGCRVWRIE